MRSSRRPVSRAMVRRVKKKASFTPNPALHWVVEVAHLVVGLIAIAVGGQLAGAVVHRRIAAGGAV